VSLSLLPATTPSPLSERLLVDIAAGIAQVPDAWRSLVRHCPDGRHPVRLVGTRAYEVWVIGWLRDQHVRPHDHGGSAAAVLVTDGELTERRLTGEERSYVAGAVQYLGPDTIHDVVNTRDEPATSIHVYSPPLQSMTYYHPISHAPVETVVVEHEVPMLSSWYGARLLHPARTAAVPAVPSVPS
jgi:quercetin dioxygenase-like cupin family protein